MSNEPLHYTLYSNITHWKCHSNSPERPPKATGGKRQQMATQRQTHTYSSIHIYIYLKCIHSNQSKHSNMYIFNNTTYPVKCIQYIIQYQSLTRANSSSIQLTILLLFLFNLFFCLIIIKKSTPFWEIEPVFRACAVQ